MEEIIYSLCSLTALMCAWLLLQAYRRTKYGLLLWTGLFFSIATAGNIFLMVDKLIVPSIDLTLYRYGIALIGLGVLLPRLIFEKE